MQLPGRIRQASRVLAIALACAGVTAQQTPPAQKPPVFRGGTTLVPLDVKVLDKNGKPVTDLKQSDFTVYEDNVKQNIQAFFPQKLTPRPVSPDEADAPAMIPASDTDPLAPKTRRTFLLVLGLDRSQLGTPPDPLHPEAQVDPTVRVRGPGRGVEGALSFVRERLLPQDLVAVLAFNRVTDVTTNHARIVEVLERYQREHVRIAFAISEHRILKPRAPLTDEIQAEMDSVMTGQTPAEALAAIKTNRSLAGTRVRNATDLLLRIDPALERKANTLRNEPSFDDVQDFSGRVLHLTLSDAVAITDLIKVYGGIEYLRHLEGDKHLVFLGRRIFFDHKEDDARLSSRANDAKVALDIIHTMGIGGSSNAPPGTPLTGNESALDELLQISSSQNMAEWSGGYYTGVTKADRALAYVDESTRASYLIGYEPTNPAIDGTRRELKVKVNRPGVTVVFRHDYTPVETLSAVGLKDLIISSRLASGGGYAAEAKDVKLQATASQGMRLGVSGQIRVDMTIDASKIAFSPSAEGRVAELEVEIFCGDDKKAVIGDLKQHLSITADDETHARFLREGIPFSVRVPAAGTVKFVKIVVYDPGADLMGTYIVNVK